jgi:hypothetical protein
MIRLTGTVTYRDGRTELIEVTQAEYAGFELWALRHGIPANPEGAPPMTMTRYLGYQATQRAAHDSAELWEPWEAWDGEVMDVTLEPESADGSAEANPTRTDRSAV